MTLAFGRRHSVERFVLLIPSFLFLSSVVSGCTPSKPAHVDVSRNGEAFELRVDGKPFYIQGVGLGVPIGRKGENYVAMAKELGANALRTWGTDQGDSRYLRLARKYGFYVDAGIWLDYVDPKNKISYKPGFEYRRRKEREIIRYVTRFKSHPSILMWNIGNEAMAMTQDEPAKVEIAEFLEQMIQRVHRIDPHHPVVYACADTREFALLKKYCPSLDIVGVNNYGSPIMVQSRWIEAGFSIPYLFTEFGHLGPWDRPKNETGAFIEASDETKAQQYRNHWNLTRERRGHNLGGFVFHLGETTQESMSYWNINHHALRKEPFLVMQKLYLRLPTTRHAPKIRSFEGVPEAAKTGERVAVEVGAQPGGDARGLVYRYFVSTSIEGPSGYYVNKEIPVAVRAKGPRAEIGLPSIPGKYRVYALIEDASGCAAIQNRAVELS